MKKLSQFDGTDEGISAGYAVDFGEFDATLGSRPVKQMAPPVAVTSVSSTTGASTPVTYILGQYVDIIVLWDAAVDVIGTPTLQLIVNTASSTIASASYLSGSGTNTLTFRYYVQAGDSTTDLATNGPNSIPANTATDAIYKAGTTTNVNSQLPTGSTTLLVNNAQVTLNGVAPTTTVSTPASPPTPAPAAPTSSPIPPLRPSAARFRRTWSRAKWSRSRWTAAPPGQRRRPVSGRTPTASPPR